MIINFENNSDEWLVKKFQEGERDALSLLIKRHHEKLLKTIQFQIRGNGPVEDIAQECWYSIIEKLPHVELKISFSAWATTIARHKSIDWIRSQQLLGRKGERIAMDVENKTETNEVFDDQKNLEKVHFAIQRLSPAQRVILKMFYMDNLSLKEISKILDVSKGTVKSRLFYAREKLKEIISQ